VTMHLIDGGLSTELESLGANFQSELWTGQALLNSPDLVLRAHKNFVDAGAEVIISSSYQLSRSGFEEIGLSAKYADRALEESVELARSAVHNSSCQVAASIGPYGAILHDGSEFRGDYKLSQSQLEDFHFERLEIILAAKPDMLAVETIPNVIETKALVNVLRKTDLPTWFSFTAASGSKMWSGEHIEDAAGELAGLTNLVAAGVNCVQPSQVKELTTRINVVTGLPAIAYPNGGGKWDASTNTWSGQDSKSLVDWISQWTDTAIDWVGGCCGTSAQEIAKVKLALSQSLGK
jgi:homocysteine S-methyltransferase